MPINDAAYLEDDCLVNGRHWATKAEIIGDHTQLWHVRADVEARSELVLSDWEPMTLTPPFHLRSEVRGVPLLGSSPIKVEILDRSTHVLLAELTNARVRLDSQSSACQTWAIEDSKGGWHLKAWLKLWHDQCAVDLRAGVTWSDPTNPEMLSRDVIVRLVTCVPSELYFADKSGFSRLYNGRTWNLWVGPLSHGVTIPVRGVMLPPSSSPMQEVMNAAAIDAPLVGACPWGSAPWLAFGAYVRTPDLGPDAESTNYLDDPGVLFQARPFANLIATGSTGDQPCFGATKDLVAVTHGNPWRVYELLYSAEDYLLRSRHHYESDGTRVTVDNRPGFQTWSGCINEYGHDRLGKARPFTPSGWGDMQGRPVGLDDQHRGDGYIIATYALTGDELLREDLLCGIEADRARAMHANGWLDAPRASGRLWQSWAKQIMLFDGDNKIVGLLIAMALDELTDREERELRSDDGEVISMENVIDPRVLAPRSGWVPWNQALAVTGALEMACALSALELHEESERFLAFAKRHGENILKNGVGYDAAQNQFVPLLGVLWSQAGRQPLSYYVFPRDGTTGEGRDVIVGSGGWWSWMFGAAVAATLSDNRDIRALARHLIQSNGTSSETKWLEWISVYLPLEAMV